MKLKANVDTVIKVRPDQSSLLDADQIITIPKGTEIEIQEVIEDQGHLSFETYLWANHVNQNSEIQYSAEDIDTMARTLWGEARGEEKQGRIAVAWVIRNRATKSPAYNWPNTPKAVCRQPWQFSCWNSNDPNLPKMKGLTERDSIFRECLAVANDVLNGNVSDPTNGADHYYAISINTPSWAIGKKPTVTIGHHRFYELI